MSADYSLEALLQFLELAGDKGWLRKPTARARRVAAGKVLEVLDPSERSDLRTVDIEEAFRRFTNLNSGYNPRSLQEYRRRVKLAVRDFVSYTEDPVNFKFPDSSRSQKSKDGGNESKSPKRPKRSLVSSTEQRVASDSLPNPTRGISIPIPLREGVTVHVQHIPFDLTTSEAERIAAIVRAYAMPAQEK